MRNDDARAETTARALNGETTMTKERQEDLRFSGDGFALANVAASLAQTDLYFGYGSNMNRDQMKHRAPLATFVGPASLTGWRLVSRGVADVERTKGGKVGGALWCLTSSDLSALDRYEGFPHYYSREIVRVLTDRGELWAWVYVMTSGHARKEYPFSAGYALACAEGARQCGVPVSTLYLRDIATGPTGKAIRPWKIKPEDVSSGSADPEPTKSERPLPKHARLALEAWGKKNRIDPRRVANMVYFATYDEERETIRVAGGDAYVTIEAPLRRARRDRAKTDEVTAEELECLEEDAERLLRRDDDAVARAERLALSPRDESFVARCRERLEAGGALSDDMRERLDALTF